MYLILLYTFLYFLFDRNPCDGNRIDITWGKYSLIYPSRLVTVNGMIHRSDLNGYENGFVVDRKIYDLINSDCLTISESIEHSVFWNERTFDNNFRHTMNNFYLLLANLKENDVSTMHFRYMQISMGRLIVILGEVLLNISNKYKDVWWNIGSENW